MRQLYGCMNPHCSFSCTADYQQNFTEMTSFIHHHSFLSHSNAYYGVSTKNRNSLLTQDTYLQVKQAHCIYTLLLPAYTKIHHICLSVNSSHRNWWFIYLSWASKQLWHLSVHPYTTVLATTSHEQSNYSSKKKEKIAHTHNTQKQSYFEP